MPRLDRIAACAAAVLLALICLGSGETVRAEPQGSPRAGLTAKTRATAQADEAKFHRFETGQSFLLLSRDRRRLYVRGLVDMIYYVYLQRGSSAEGKEALRTCLDAQSANALELRLRNHLRRFPKQWDQPAASLFWVTVQRTCNVRGVQN